MLSLLRQRTNKSSLMGNASVIWNGQIRLQPALNLAKRDTFPLAGVNMRLFSTKNIEIDMDAFGNINGVKNKRKASRKSSGGTLHSEHGFSSDDASQYHGFNEDMKRRPRRHGVETDLEFDWDMSEFMNVDSHAAQKKVKQTAR